MAARHEILDTFSTKINFPGRLVFIPMSGREVVEALRERRIEIGITQHELESHEFIRKKWFEDRFHLIAPESWLNPKLRFEAGLKKLVLKPRLSYGSSDIASGLEKYFPAGPIPEPFRVDPSWQRIVKMVTQGLGWAFVPELQLGAASKIASIPLPEEAKPAIDFYFMYSKELAKLPWFRELVTQLRV